MKKQPDSFSFSFYSFEKRGNSQRSNNDYYYCRIESLPLNFVPIGRKLSSPPSPPKPHG